MVVSISGVLLLGVIVFVLTRKCGLKTSHAVVCSLFGFYLAGTSIAPEIRQGGRSLATFISGIEI